MALNNYSGAILSSTYTRARALMHIRTRERNELSSLVAVSLLVFPNVEATASFN